MMILLKILNDDNDDHDVPFIMTSMINSTSVIIVTVATLFFVIIIHI